MKSIYRQIILAIALEREDVILFISSDRCILVPLVVSSLLFNGFLLDFFGFYQPKKNTLNAINPVYVKIIKIFQKKT
jgi:hypothetical protein